jgi:hypothetical protein
MMLVVEAALWLLLGAFFGALQRHGAPRATRRGWPVLTAASAALLGGTATRVLQGTPPGEASVAGMVAAGFFALGALAIHELFSQPRSAQS